MTKIYLLLLENDDLYHIQLLEKYLLMLTTAELFNSSIAGNGLELEIVQSAIRVLLSCVANENKDVSSQG